MERLVVGKMIEQVQVRYAKMIGTEVDSFVHDLPGQTFERSVVGASICFLPDGWVLVSTSENGRQVSFYPDAVPERKHAHVFSR